MRSFTFLLFLFSTLSLSAQSSLFSVEVEDTTLYGVATQNTFYGDIDLYNTSGGSLDMTWHTFEVNVPNGWTVSNCDPGTCHPVGVMTSSFTMINSNPEILNTHFYPNGVAGSGYIKVSVYPTNAPQDSIVLTYYGVAGAVGMEELSEQDVEVFPVPARDVVNVSFPTVTEQVELQLMDLTGKTIVSKRSQGGIEQFSLEGLDRGIYLLRITQGQTVLTRKVVKS